MSSPDNRPGKVEHVPRHGQPTSGSDALERIRQLISSKDYESAAALAKSVADTSSDDPVAQLVAADCLRLNDEFEAAFQYVERAERSGAEPVACLYARAKISRMTGSGRESLALLDKALAEQPDTSTLLRERSSVFMSLGETDKAQKDLSRMVELDKRDLRALHKLTQIPGCSLSDKQIKQTEFILSSGQLTAFERAFGHFALASTYEHMDEPDRQFKHLDKGNAILAARYRYDEAFHRAEVDSMIADFPKEWFDGALAAGKSKQRLIFIVGMPRSGSTLIEQMLASHSQAGTIGERDHLARAASRFAQDHATPGRTLAQLCRDAGPGGVSSIAEDYLERVARRGGTHAPVVIDKTLGNYLFIGILQLLFPNAKFIHSRRNPVATCYGCYKRLFSDGEVQFSYSLETLSAVYHDSNRLIEHWKRLMPDRFFTMDYESLVHDTESHCRNLLRFCELDWEQGCLDYHENKQLVNSASRMQVKQAVFRHGVDTWRSREKYLGPLLHLQHDGARQDAQP